MKKLAMFFVAILLSIAVNAQEKTIITGAIGIKLEENYQTAVSKIEKSYNVSKKDKSGIRFEGLTYMGHAGAVGLIKPIDVAKPSKRTIVGEIRIFYPGINRDDASKIVDKLRLRYERNCDFIQGNTWHFWEDHKGNVLGIEHDYLEGTLYITYSSSLYMAKCRAEINDF